MTTIPAAQVTQMLIERGIEPDRDYIAAAGQDYGYVAAWEMPHGQWLIQYGDNGATHHALAANADNLYTWLLPSDIEPADQLIHLANVRGADAIEEAAPTAREVGVIVTRHYYDDRDISALAADDRGQPLLLSYADAEQWIEDASEGQYILDHNEASEPSYKIVAL